MYKCLSILLTQKWTCYSCFVRIILYEKREKNYMNRKILSLRKSLIFIIVICWTIPIIVIAAFMTMSYRDNIILTTNRNIQTSLKNFTASVAGKIDEAIDMQRQISYESRIEYAWKSYNGKDNESSLYAEIKGVLNAKFHNDKRFEMSCLFLADDKDKIYYTTRNEENYKIYKENVHKKALEISDTDTSSINLLLIDKRIYIIRNLYTISNYTKFATLITELNKNALFEAIDKQDMIDMGFYLQNTESIAAFDEEIYDEDKSEILDKISECYTGNKNYTMNYIKAGDYEGYLYERKYRDFNISTAAIVDTKLIYSEINQLYILVLVIVSAMFPLLIYIVYFLNKNISVPIEIMIKASKKMENGEIGTIIEDINMPNDEFEYLKEAFNTMSMEVKYLFEYAYSEQLARKDAKIIALQSQINPHFLNNTLEMMNWQARMAGDMTVSKMIEALGTLLDYSMDRSNRKLIPLNEELRCADAYFYIVSMRFGQRLKVEKEVDSSLLQEKVPELILQPILENAVVHGVEEIKHGIIWLKIYKENEDIVMQIINTGRRLRQNELDKIKSMLDGSYMPKEGEAGKHTSIGIRNVNERIKLIYGKKYGLTIEQNSNDEVISTIRIPYGFMPDDTQGDDDFCSDLFNVANIYK